jgi:hypothetical protein
MPHGSSKGFDSYNIKLDEAVILPLKAIFHERLLKLLLRM